ncbi:arylsulfatase [Phyllobacterium sp. 22552]|uniref:arylsulfatase n=1 Tax=Phyllobacterium sp. 22552 TaxID=3453941 RepID=UPI003F82C31D
MMSMKYCRRSLSTCCSMLILSMTMSSTSFAQESLPFPPTPRPKAERTMELSTYAKPEALNHLPADAPNILIVMLDDTGPALPATYGGPINTPTLSAVANAGVSYNRFHNAAMCSPTRAALLTGRNQHRVGFGQIAEFANAWEGYTGSWPATTASVAKVLGYYGYATSAFGKWHNTSSTDISRMGPYDRWPTGRLVGFDYFYGFIAGEASQWEPAIVENTSVVEPKHDREGYHFTQDMTDKAISWLRNHRAVSPGQPFMMYWTPGAAHGPHHIFKEWADKYKGKFDAGWDVMREEVFANQKKQGWVPASTELTPRPGTLAGWDSIPDDEKPFQRRLMEVYAGFVEHADTQAGRLLEELDRMGVRDNTLIFYVWGDNGSSSEGQNGTISELLAQNGIPSDIKDHIRVLNELGGLDVLGGPKTDNMYHAGWAWAGSSPFQSTKLVAAHFGGTRTPLAISWPKAIKHDIEPRSQFYHVNDIVPTIYDVLKITPPKVVEGVSQEPIDGVSMVASFNDPKVPANKKEQYFEVMGSRGYYKDGWFASVFGPRIPWKPGIDPKIVNWSPDNDKWELYDLSKDFSQARNIADENPEKLKELVSSFDAAAYDNKVYPVGGGLWSMVFHPEDAPHNPATEFFYTKDVFGLPEASAAKVGVLSNLATINLELTPESKGVLYAVGAYSGGMSVWVENGKLTYEYNAFQIERTRIESTKPLPTGKVKLEIETRKSKGPIGPLAIVIRANGEDIASGTVPRSASIGFTPNDAFDVGMDSYSPVSEAYFDRAPFKFNGKIENMHVKYLR